MSTTTKSPRATSGKGSCKAVDPGKGQACNPNIIGRRHFSTVGQAKKSNDCGFFSGMVFSVARQCSSFSGMMMAEKDVYRARNRFLKPRNPTDGPGTGWLQPRSAPFYLASMGLRGKLKRQRNWSTEESSIATLKKLLGGSNCHGLMIVIGLHWIAVINPFWIGGSNERDPCFYNPAPDVVPHATRKTLEQLAIDLHYAGPRSVVWVERTI